MHVFYFQPFVELIGIIEYPLNAAMKLRIFYNPDIKIRVLSSTMIEFPLTYD